MTYKVLRASVFPSLVIALLFGCTQSKETTSTVDESEEVAEPVEVASVELPAVCIWDKVSVRETPGAKTKYITSISIGESLTSLGKDSIVNDRTYTYVVLNDGKEGWTLKDFIVENAKPAVMMADVSLYARPDLLTKSDKTFKMMDIVSSIETQGEWMKIKGRRFGAKWMDEGWVKSANVSFEAIDIATAKFASEALAIENNEEKIEAIVEIVNNVDLSGSKFMSELEKLKSELSPVEEENSMGEELSEELVEEELIDAAVEGVESAN